MVARTDDLVVKIAADITELRRGLKESVKSTKTASQRMKKAIASIGTPLRRVAKLTAGLTLGFGYFAKRVINTGDRIGKLSARLKVSTEFLSEYGHVADLAGTSLESVAKGVQFMQKAIGEAKIGLGEGKRALEELGLNIDALNRLSSEQQFDVITQSIAGLKDQTLKLAITQKIFGRSGVELINIMNQSTGAIKQQREEANRLGLVYSGVTAKAMEEFNDNLTRFYGVLKGTAIKIFTEHKEALLEFTRSLSSDKMINAINNFIKSTGKMGRGVKKIVEFLVSVVDKIQGFIDKIKEFNEICSKNLISYQKNLKLKRISIVFEMRMWH